MEQQDLTPLPKEINIEEIMQTIRQQILARRAVQLGETAPIIQVTGKRLAPEFYEHLYQVGMSYNRIEIAPYITQSTIPVIGPLLDWLRRKVHELVVYYVNQMAAHQIHVNTHMLRTVSLMAEELEKESQEEA